MTSLFLVIQHALQHFTLPLSSIHTYMNINKEIRQLILESTSYVSISVDDTDMNMLPWALYYKLPIRYIQLSKMIWDRRIPIDHKTIHIEIPLDRVLTDKDISYCSHIKALILPKNRSITDKGIIDMKQLTAIDLSSNRNITDKGIMNKDLKHITFVFNHKITDVGFTNCTSIETLCMGYTKQKKLTCSFLKNHTPRSIVLHNKRLHDRLHDTTTMDR